MRLLMCKPWRAAFRRRGPGPAAEPPPSWFPSGDRGGGRPRCWTRPLRPRSHIAVGAAPTLHLAMAGRGRAPLQPAACSRGGAPGGMQQGRRKGEGPGGLKGGLGGARAGAPPCGPPPGSLIRLKGTRHDQIKASNSLFYEDRSKGSKCHIIG